MKRTYAIFLALFLLTSACGINRNNEDEEQSTENEENKEQSTENEENEEQSTESIELPANTKATLLFPDESEEEISTDSVTSVSESIASYADVFGPLAPEELERQTVTFLLQQELLKYALESNSLEVTEADKKEVEEALTAEIDRFFTASQIDKDAEELLAEDTPYINLLLNLSYSEAAIRNSIEIEGQDPCASHILIGYPQEERPQEGLSEADYAKFKEEADAVFTNLQAGADFATIAKEKSVDTGSGEIGGELGCGPTVGYVPEFAEAVDTAEIGKLVEPVKTEFGWHIILVTGTAPSAEEAAEKINTFILEISLATEITIDPELGTWDSERSAIIPSESGLEEQGVPAEQSLTQEQIEELQKQLEDAGVNPDAEETSDSDVQNAE